MSNKNNKKTSIRKIVLWVVITNIITVILLTTVPIPFIGRKLVSQSDYEFLFDYRKLVRVHNVLEKKYVDSITPQQEEKMIDGAIKGMTAGIGDPYTGYMNKEEYKAFVEQTIHSSYAGVGLYLTEKDNKIVVTEPIEGGPAIKAGIKPGDAIVKVNGTSVNAKESDKAVAMMKGEEGTEVTLTIERSGEENKDIKLKRAVIDIKTVKSEVVDNIGYIRISSFDDTTGEQFKQHAEALNSKGVKGIVIDLRGNPGGILDEAVKVLDVLLDEEVVVTTVDNGGKKTEYKTQNGKIDLPLTVLVDGNSASASEIVSGTLKDLNRATLIGSKTYGKQLVQATIDLQDKTGLKFTISRYYTPSKIEFQGKGIEPNIKLNMPEVTKIEKNISQDSVFKEAVKVLESK